MARGAAVATAADGREVTSPLRRSVPATTVVIPDPAGADTQAVTPYVPTALVRCRHCPFDGRVQVRVANPRATTGQWDCPNCGATSTESDVWQPGMEIPGSPDEDHWWFAAKDDPR